MILVFSVKVTKSFKGKRLQSSKTIRLCDSHCTIDGTIFRYGDRNCLSILDRLSPEYRHPRVIGILCIKVFGFRIPAQEIDFCLVPQVRSLLSLIMGTLEKSLRELEETARMLQRHVAGVKLGGLRRLAKVLAKSMLV